MFEDCMFSLSVSQELCSFLDTWERVFYYIICQSPMHMNFFLNLVCSLFCTQDLLVLEKVKSDLQREIGREPSIGEWSRAVGMEQNAFELRVKEGRYSKDKMVNSNLRLVVSIVKNYQGRGMTLPDLIQVRFKRFLCVPLNQIS